MEKKTIEELNQIYDLELDTAINTIKKQKAKKVLLQFPEGMKPYSQTISDYLRSKTGSDFFIWLDTCFGACDLPQETEKLGIDLIIQFGHSDWSYKRKDIKVLK